MKVLMQGRFGLLSVSGGDRIQVENTASELKNLGIDVDFSSDINADLKDYDIVHIFQMDWTAETHFMIKNAKLQNKPVVLSPIHHKVSEVKKFDDEYVFDLRRLSKLIFKEQHNRDVFKNVYRSFLKPSMLGVTLKSVFKGLKNMHTESLRLSDIVLVQTELEAKDLKQTYGVEFKWKIVPNGVSEKFLNTSNLKNPLDIKNYIFCVGRVEPRKNQLNVIKAVEKLRDQMDIKHQLLIIGTKSPRNHPEYTIKFNKILKENDWIHYIPKVPYENMPAYFKYAKVCISASWFETTGLTLLEALYCGTNAVASSPRAKEILGEYASYCEPNNVDSMVKALKKEYNKPRPVIDSNIRDEYTWHNAAKKTYEVYKELLKNA